MAFDALAHKYSFTEAMRAAGWQVFRQTEVTEPIHGYGDLAVLNDLLVQRFLVTSAVARLLRLRGCMTRKLAFDA